LGVAGRDQPPRLRRHEPDRGPRDGVVRVRVTDSAARRRDDGARPGLARREDRDARRTERPQAHLPEHACGGLDGLPTELADREHPVIAKPHVDWFAISPELVLLGVSALAIFAAVLVPRWLRKALAAFVCAGGFLGAFVAA